MVLCRPAGRHPAVVVPVTVRRRVRQCVPGHLKHKIASLCQVADAFLESFLKEQRLRDVVLLTVRYRWSGRWEARLTQRGAVINPCCVGVRL